MLPSATEHFLSAPIVEQGCDSIGAGRSVAVAMDQQGDEGILRNDDKTPVIAASASASLGNAPT